MNAILDHRWGESVALDSFWASVSGMAPSLLRDRLFLLLHGYFDESEDENHHFFVLAGALSTPEKWAAFTAEWEKLLPHASMRPSDNAYIFKFDEMVRNPERIERIPWFWSTLQEYAQCLVSVAIEIPALRAAQSRVRGPAPIEWRTFDDPWMVAFVVLLEGLFWRRKELTSLIPEKSVTDFFFDQHGNERKIRDGWEKFVDGAPSDIRKMIGKKPRFEDDAEYLPLQAADLVAGYVRTSGRRDKGLAVHQQLQRLTSPIIPTINLRMKEDNLVRWLAGKLPTGGLPLVDAKTGQRLRSLDDKS